MRLLGKKESEERMPEFLGKFCEEEPESLKRLSRATKALNEFVMPRIPNVEYKVENGHSYGYGLLKIPGKIGVQLNELIRKDYSKGTTFTRHNHKGVELLIIFEGLIEVVYNDQPPKMAGVGDCIKLIKGEPHSVRVVEDTGLIGITIPDDEAYPDAPGR